MVHFQWHRLSHPLHGTTNPASDAVFADQICFDCLLATCLIRLGIFFFLPASTRMVRHINIQSSDVMPQRMNVTTAINYLQLSTHCCDGATVCCRFTYPLLITWIVPICSNVTHGCSITPMYTVPSHRHFGCLLVINLAGKIAVPVRRPVGQPCPNLSANSVCAEGFEPPKPCVLM